MATIGEEVGSVFVSTNVTDSTQVYNPTYKTVSAGVAGYSTFVIKDGELYATGLNLNGQLGVGDNLSKWGFTKTNLANVKSVSYGGGSFAIALKLDGTLWATGSNYFGVFGTGGDESSNVFVDTGLGDVAKAVASHGSVYAIKHNGSLWAVGDNSDGQLCLGDTTHSKVYTDTGLRDVVDVVASHNHVFISFVDGTIKCAGRNTEGQLGLGDNINRAVATETTLTNVAKIYAGFNTSAYISDSGNLYVSGDKNFNNLGLQNSTNVFVYTGLGDVVDMCIDNTHSVAITSTGDVYVVGYNDKGQLGTGDTTRVENLTQISFTGATHVWSGRNATIILKADGTLWGTGNSGHGEIGSSSSLYFVDIGITPDEYDEKKVSLYREGDIVRQGDKRYLIHLLQEESPSSFVELTEIGVVNSLKALDSQNVTPALCSFATMDYIIKSIETFNSFALAKVLCDTVTYTFFDKNDALVKTGTRSVDCKRDKDGVLSRYPTTVIFYADAQIEEGGYVEVSLSNASGTGEIELGDFILCNTVDFGFTDLSFTHGIKDYNDYTPDAWGNIATGTKAIVTTFNITMDFMLENYDYMVSLNESIAGKNVIIDACDSGGELADGETIFGSLVRRVRVQSPSIKTKITDGELAKTATISILAQEIA